MVHTFRTVVYLLAAAAVAVQAATTCGASASCPSDSPCCSEYGECGVGAYCLGGCDPRYSYNLESCVARPVCKSANYILNSLDDVIDETEYLGNASAHNWVSTGTPVVYQDKAILLTMAENTVGTLLTSTHYVWYGKISASLTTSQGAGVVTAFILMSDVQDEMDFEFVGVALQDVQSNYYWQGVPNYDNEVNLTAANTEEETHTYTYDWQPDSLSWAVDGNVLRTLYRNETYNTTDGTYHFPQTPARIELSLWPAGLSTEAEGTIEWAGGLVDWNSPYMQNGYYYAMFENVTVECYDPPTGYDDEGTESYEYTSKVGTNNTVAITNNNTILASLYATGNNESYNPDASSASSSANTVPGVSGGGARGSTSGTSSDSGSSDASSSASAALTSSTSTSFSQGLQGTNDGARVVAGSLVALVAFFAAAMLI